MSTSNCTYKNTITDIFGKSTVLIAEIGNCHLGNLDKAKELVRAAKDCGADLCKSQAFIGKDIKHGSMPKSFYRKCELTFEQYVELIEYGEQIGIDVFYSIFSRNVEQLIFHQKWHKIAGIQTMQGFNHIEKKDTDRVFVSIPEGGRKPKLEHCHIMHVSAYLTYYPGLQNIDHLTEIYGRQCGYSDHTIGITHPIKAVKEYGANVIEKHFTLDKDIQYLGQLYRDAVHSSLPQEFEKLAKEIK